MDGGVRIELGEKFLSFEWDEIECYAIKREVDRMKKIEILGMG